MFKTQDVAKHTDKATTPEKASLWVSVANKMLQTGRDKTAAIQRANNRVRVNTQEHFANFHTDPFEGLDLQFESPRSNHEASIYGDY